MYMNKNIWIHTYIYVMITGYKAWVSRDEMFISGQPMGKHAGGEKHQCLVWELRGYWVPGAMVCYT